MEEPIEEVKEPIIEEVKESVIEAPPEKEQPLIAAPLTPKLKHLEISIPKIDWAYKLEAMTTKVDEYEREFMYIIPHCFAAAATPEAL